MAEITVDQRKCTGCKRCIGSCPFGAIFWKDSKIRITQNCRLCRLCEKTCPFGALLLEQHLAKKAPTGWRGILVYIQNLNQRIHPVAFELIEKARDLSKGEPVFGVFVGRGGEMWKKKLRLCGTDKVAYYADETYCHFREDSYTKAVKHCILKYKPRIVLFGATPEGRSIAARAAIELKTGLTADCTALDIDNEGNLLQTRPAFGGAVMAQIITPWTRPQCATVRPGVLGRKMKKIPGVADIEELYTDAASKIKIMNWTKLERPEDIADCKRLVAIGAGIKRKEDIPRFRELANHMNAKLASSRALVEKGWMPPETQIGLSGRSVQPDLLITLGISGSVQFLAGIQGAKKIIAVNTDPDARIFKTAHVLIGEDLYKLTEELEQQWK